MCITKLSITLISLALGSPCPLSDKFSLCQNLKTQFCEGLDIYWDVLSSSWTDLRL